MVKKIQTLLEYILIIAYSIAVFSTRFDAPFQTIPHIYPIATLIITAVCILMVIGYLRTPTSPLSFIRILALTSTAHFVLHGTGSPLLPVPPLALLVMVSTGLAGKNYSWIIPFLIFTLGETVRSLALLLFNGVPVTSATLMDERLLDPFRYLYLLCAGMLPALLSASYRLERYAPRKASLPQSIGQGPFPEPPSPPDIIKTKAFTVNLSEYTSSSDSKEIEDLLSSVVYFMSRNFRCFSSLGFIFDPKRQAFVLNSFHSKSVNIIKGVAIPLGSGIIGRIGTEKRSFMTGDLHVYNSDLQYYGAEEHINSILAVPIISEQNELLGTLVLDSNNRQAFKDQDKDTLKRFSYLAAALITTARMRSLQEKSARTFQTFYEASHQFTTALKAEHVFKVLFEVVPTVVSCSRQIGVVFDEEKGVGTVLCVSGTSSDLAPGFTFPINAGLYSFVFQKRKSIMVADFQQCADRYYRFVPDEINTPAIRSLIIFPIIDDEQRCRGLFSIESEEPDAFPPDVERILTTLIENASVAFIRAILYQRMERLATIDGLTELNNHRHFQELLAGEIERSRRYKRPLALLIMDIDHFKTFNDTYGHPVGDLVLKEIAMCIRKSIRLNDTPARYGGEEFVVIIPETSEKGAFTTAERIRSAIERHTVISLDRRLQVTISIGCSAYPENAPSQQALIDTADKALYAAKKSGRNRVVLYQEGM
ncbi:MAG: GGDEF domain-containing protein [Chitinispirillaceae bacterium]|nr:GGDEF domain-containing protein [Chitinispirillaceae bacterium]